MARRERSDDGTPPTALRPKIRRSYERKPGENFESYPTRATARSPVGTFDRSLVVTAGAGTGKTTLLVDRLVHLILRNPEPLKITEIVALTFTNKAADEIKLRLRERLQAYLAVELDRAARRRRRRKNPAQSSQA